MHSRHSPISLIYSAQPTLIGSSDPLRPEQPQCRNSDAVRKTGFLCLRSQCVSVHLSAPSTPTCPSAVLSKLICSSLHLTINSFYLIYFTIFWLCRARLPEFYLVWLGTVTFLSYHISLMLTIVLVYCLFVCYRTSSGVYVHRLSWVCNLLN